MIRNLPKVLLQQDFVMELNAGFEGTFDFAYLPRNFASGECKGYAFVNFIDPVDASRFRAAWHQTYRFGLGPRDRVLDVSPAHIQGYEANVAKAQSPHACNIRNPNYRRLIVNKDGEEGGGGGPRLLEGAIDMPPCHVDVAPGGPYHTPASGAPYACGGGSQAMGSSGSVILSTPGGSSSSQAPPAHMALSTNTWQQQQHLHQQHYHHQQAQMPPHPSAHPDLHLGSHPGVHHGGPGGYRGGRGPAQHILSTQRFAHQDMPAHAHPGHFADPQVNAYKLAGDRPSSYNLAASGDFGKNPYSSIASR
jgi:hypothetical protein